MRVKKHKATRRIVRYYKLHFGFREPFKVRNAYNSIFMHAPAIALALATRLWLLQMLCATEDGAPRVATLARPARQITAATRPSITYGEVCRVPGVRASLAAGRFNAASDNCLAMQVLLDGNFLHAITQLKYASTRHVDAASGCQLTAALQRTCERTHPPCHWQGQTVLKGCTPTS